jgi:hypothetical protein
MSLLLPGDADILINGERRRLRLTLGALAHLEAAIGGGDFERLRERLKAPSASDLLLILHALLQGGGATMTLDLLKASDVDFAAAARAIGEAFRALAGGAAVEMPDTDDVGGARAGAATVAPGKSEPRRARGRAESNLKQVRAPSLPLSPRRS